MKIDYREIGRRIAKRRHDLGLKQTEVEERADLGSKYLSNIERGVSIPSTEVIIRLAFALDTTPDEFLVGVSAPAENAALGVAQKLRGLNDRQLALISELIDAVKRFA